MFPLFVTTIYFPLLVDVCLCSVHGCFEALVCFPLDRCMRRFEVVGIRFRGSFMSFRTMLCRTIEV